MRLPDSESLSLRDAAKAWFGGLAAVVVLVIALRIVGTYGFYFPPDFDRGFLQARQAYFWRSFYWVGFYLHIIGAPIALICGLPQFSRLLLCWSPRTHRLLGRIYALAVLLGAAPGGFIMGFRSFAGIPALLCFSLMSLLVSVFTILAWRDAVRRRFVSHRRWMIRSYLMMASAVLLRLIDPVLRDLGVSDMPSYVWSLWLSWVPSLLIFELAERCVGKKGST
jgi:uncharacterized membrane protein